MSDEAQEYVTATATMVALEPIEAALKISCQLKSKWVIKIIGKDENGVDRCLGLDWDGVWHPLDPVTGQHTRIRALVKFRDLRVGEVAFNERAEDSWPYAARTKEGWTWTRLHWSPRFLECSQWDGEDDLVRIFSVDANQQNLEQKIAEHHATTTEAKR